VVPSIGGILLFGDNKEDILPDAKIKCARFKGIRSTEFLDNFEIKVGLINAVDEVISFIRRHTMQGLEIGAASHKVIPEYPEIALREAVINAIVHTDYSSKGMSIRVGIYDDRIEISNPGGLPFGISMEHIFSGISKLRNRVVGRVFHELRLIEQWGTGISRIKETCQIAGLPEPRFEELGTSFRVTLFSGSVPRVTQRSWELQLVEYLQINKEISSKQAADLWGISERAARMKLKILIEDRVITKIATNPNDPKTVYVLQSWN
jgi:predicted HTH transcriptional regulator